MPYTKNSWVDNETIIYAADMERIEDGISDVTDTVEGMDIDATVDGETGTPSVSVSKSGNTWTFAFSGLKGAQGDKGDKGDTGDAGTNGADGADGTTIDTVDVTVGTGTGSTPTGSGSISGTTLTLNFDNLKGEKGDAGENGAAGTAGTNGTNGTDGEDGEGIASLSLSFTFTVSEGQVTGVTGSGTCTGTEGTSIPVTVSADISSADEE